MIDLGDLTVDPDFCEPFVIRRRTGAWGLGGYTGSPADTPVLGVAIATNSDDLEQLPEGDKTAGMMTFYCRQPLRVAAVDQGTDEILWSGNMYKVVEASDWKRHGFYKAIARKMGPDGSGV
jgi:hypothetical protein